MRSINPYNMLRLFQSNQAYRAVRCVEQLTSLRTFSAEHDFDTSSNISIVGAYTPVTKRLWQQRYRWTEETIAAAERQTEVHPKPPHRTEVVYPFSSDFLLREHYRNPWDGVRIGRLLEDMDSLAGFVAYDHSQAGDTRVRPPLLVTATVDAIRIRGTELSLEKDMKLSGRVVWTGTSSMDICMELEQAGEKGGSRMEALFTFVARDVLDGSPQAVNPLCPEAAPDRDTFCARQRVADARKAARARAKAAGVQWSSDQEAWIASLLEAARTKRDLPALADPHSLLIDETAMENTFTAQPQQRNLQGRIFGGFLMRRAFELAHSAAHLFSASRPRTVTVDEVQFRAPVNVGDLLRFGALVLRTWQDEARPGTALMHVQVQASVTQPEKLQSRVTNTFTFLFRVELRKDEQGRSLPLMKVLPGTEEQAVAVCKFYGPGGEHPLLEE